jgi:PIN domain nuclease of toxin-antitoxin system
MEYLADTVTIIRHFSGAGHIGRQAKSILEGVEKGEHHMFLSTISLVEILYLSEKKRITINLGESLEMMDESMNYSIVDLTPDIPSKINHPYRCLVDLTSSLSFSKTFPISLFFICIQ